MSNEINKNHNGGLRKETLDITSYQLDTAGVLFRSWATVHICLSEPHKYLNIHLSHTQTFTHTCTHTNTLFQSQAPDCSSLTWFASKEGKKADCGKKGLVCEAFWINASGLPLNIHYSAIQNHEKKRINGLIEILSKGIDKKLNNPSEMLLEKKTVKRVPKF